MDQYTKDYCYCRKKVDIIFTSGRPITLDAITQQTVDNCRIYDYSKIEINNFPIAMTGIQRIIIPLSNVESIREIDMEEES